MSKAETYRLWGPRRYERKSVIVLGSDGTGDREHFYPVEAAGKVGSPDAREEERYTIFLCRGIHPSARSALAS